MKYDRHLSGLFLKCIAGLILTGVTPATAQTVWTNPGVGLWTTPGNWSAGTPNINTHAEINNGGEALLYDAQGFVNNLTLGLAPGNSGTVSVYTNISDGYLSAGTINIGDGGTGQLNISGGGDVAASDIIMGRLPGSNGTLFIGAGDAGLITPSFVSTVGDWGAATVLVSDSGLLKTGPVRLAYRAGSSAGVVVSGPSAAWQASGTVGLDSVGASVITLSFGGALNITDPAASLLLNPLSTLNVGDYSVSTLSQSGVMTGSGIVNDGTINYDHNDVTSFNVPITGNGQVKHIGPGTTTISDISGFTGSVMASDGVLILPGTPVASGFSSNGTGTLRFENATVSLTGTTIRSDAFVQYENATVNGGYLRGIGVHELSAVGANTFNSVTTFNSTTIDQNGATYFNNFSNGGTINNYGLMYFDGTVSQAGAHVNINNTLITQDFTTYGELNVIAGGVLNNLEGNLVAGGGSRTTVEATSTITMTNGVIELNGALLVNNGTITGTVNVNYGSLAKGTGAYDIVNVNQGGIYAPGTSPGIATAQTVSFDAFAYNTGKPVLQIELGGTTAGSEYDRLVVTGQLALGGTLDVVLIDKPGGGGLFNPTAGQSFDILDFGSILGTFNNIQLPALGAGLTWNTTQLYASGILSVTGAALTGDLNGDGFVGIGDLNIVLGDWNEIANPAINPGVDPRADPSGDGFVGIADLNVVLGNWNAGTPPGGVTVPEPVSEAILLIGSLALLRRHQGS